MGPVIFMLFPKVNQVNYISLAHVIQPQKGQMASRLGKRFPNKKSAESGVAPAGIKSYKFLFVLN